MRVRARPPLTIPDPAELVYGVAPRPVTVGGDLILGVGVVYPEINFTLPTMLVDEHSWPEVRRQYGRIVQTLVERAARLELSGLVVEFEHLPPMTENASWGAEITAILREGLDRGREKHSLRSALRATIVDLRDAMRPPILRSGPFWEAMRESSRRCLQSGADILSIESVGGKEVHDQALIFGDVRGIAYALGVLAARDMEWLWSELVTVTSSQRKTAGGDSACGFANTAMQLAHQGQVPETLAAVVRAMTAARSLVAMECGAVGPSKDCAYEGPVLKMITGCPISMEGKSAACAHFSPVGNIACMAADLWSNESVQNIKLLSGFAPEAFLEILAYDCRLLNVAATQGKARWMRDLLVGSDELRSPQALVLGPVATQRISQAILSHSGDDYLRTLAAGRAAVSLIRDAVGGKLGGGTMRLSPKEARWLDRIDRELDGLPTDPRELEPEIREKYGSLYDRSSYALRT